MTVETSLFERILVPLDGSPQGESVLYQAHRILCGRKGEVVLFHAQDGTGRLRQARGAEKYLKGRPEPAGPFGARGPLDLARDRWSHVCGDRPLRKVSMVALPRMAAGRGATPGRRGVETIMRLRRAGAGVARVQSGPEGDLVPSKGEPSNIRRILVPIDGSRACEAVMPAARTWPSC